MYFDANRDLDLTNDPPIKVMKEPPKGLPVASNMKGLRAVWNVELLPGPRLPGPTKVGRAPSILQAYGISAAYVRFVPATIRKGKICLGIHEYTAILSCSGPTIGRLDDPRTRLQLTPAGDEGGGMRMGGSLDWPAHAQRGRRALPDYGHAQRRRVRPTPYGGDLGILKVAPANKEVKQCGAVGVFMNKEKAVMFGAPIVTYPPPEPKEPEHKLPVGDYTPSLLNVKVGKLRNSPAAELVFGGEPANVAPAELQHPDPQGQAAGARFRPTAQGRVHQSACRQTGENRRSDPDPGPLDRIGARDLLIGGLEDTTKKIEDLKYMERTASP